MTIEIESLIFANILAIMGIKLFIPLIIDSIKIHKLNSFKEDKR